MSTNHEIETELREIRRLTGATTPNPQMEEAVRKLTEAIQRAERATTPEVGALLDGFCGGMFGRESYGTKRIEAIGPDWVIARDIDTGEVAACVETGRDIRADLEEFLIR